MLHATVVVMPAACRATRICLQVLLLASFEQGLTSQTARAVQLITETPASQGYMMSKGMVRLHRTTTSAFAQIHTMCPASGCALALPADQLPASSCLLSGSLPKANSAVLLLAILSTSHTMLSVPGVMVFQAHPLSLLAFGARRLPRAAASISVFDIHSLPRRHQLSAAEAPGPGSCVVNWRSHAK